ncbi:hypothetical protein Syn7502_03095 [Synechococcus sp. PCC 7502]|uniref:PH domain-containing protein n=1 Tax=Synechococcus sp. PCC 7502 TaxID=1173263 RepID=UPI00029FE9E5|nr:PH domain-containing protein [Synechococcus sp. PCC 7502]AFY74993.1 hypothetical protein Syn7502_03095 [Synechococcus sp. PCC 7502]
MNAPSEPVNFAETVLFDGHPALFGSVSRLVIAIATLGLGAIYFWIQSNNIKYLITSQRVVVESGIFSRRIDTLELYLVNDIELDKPFGQRLMGTGNITLIGQDHSNPVLRLVRLPLDVRELYEQLRQSVQQSKHGRRGYYREVNE